LFSYLFSFFKILRGLRSEKESQFFHLASLPKKVDLIFAEEEKEKVNKSPRRKAVIGQKTIERAKK
jgi:hypothetical protein